MIHTSVYRFLTLCLSVGDVGSSHSAGKSDRGNEVVLRCLSQPVFPWNCRLGFMSLLGCWCAIFPADTPLVLSLPSPYFNFFCSRSCWFTYTICSTLVWKQALTPCPSLLASLAEISTRVTATWSTARPNVTTSATHSTTSLWIPRTLFSLPAPSRSEMCSAASQMPKCWECAILSLQTGWVFRDSQIKPSTRIEVELSCPQLISVDPQGTFCCRTPSQILEKDSNCKITNYRAVALQMFSFMCLNGPWGCLRL